MTFDHIPRLNLANRKRAAAANDDTAPPKRHRPDAVAQLVETIKFQQQQIEKATNIWVRLKGGEDKLGDANTIFLGLVKSAMYSGSLAVKLVESQEDDVAEHEKHLDERLHDLKIFITEKQDLALDVLRQDMEAFVCEETSAVSYELLSTSGVAETVRDAVTQELNVTNCDELVEMTKFVRQQMKLAKDAPETAQDILREHEVEIGL